MGKDIKIFRFILLICVFLGIALNLTAQEYRLGPDDILKVTVYREDDLNRTVRISYDGNMSFPLLGKVKAVDCTVVELEDKLTEGLGKFIKSPQVTIFIEEYGTITVAGQVAKPGSFHLKGRLTVIEAISLAGGFTKIASRNDVKIMRDENGDKKAIRIRVADISQQGDTSKDISLRRGDIVFVPESLF